MRLRSGPDALGDVSTLIMRAASHAVLRQYDKGSIKPAVISRHFPPHWSAAAAERKK
jgi:hypothetical protein